MAKVFIIFADALLAGLVSRGFPGTISLLCNEETMRRICYRCLLNTQAGREHCSGHEGVPLRDPCFSGIYWISDTAEHLFPDVEGSYPYSEYFTETLLGSLGQGMQQQRRISTDDRQERRPSGLKDPGVEQVGHIPMYGGGSHNLSGDDSHLNLDDP